MRYEPNKDMLFKALEQVMTLDIPKARKDRLEEIFNFVEQGRQDDFDSHVGRLCHNGTKRNRKNAVKTYNIFNILFDGFLLPAPIVADR